ncbi:MAG: VWA domain-containing protein [Spirochaetaceae bacterium]|nr:MAG: VWA domain-containing protein [Spirochaetaceae bacterium]
MFDRPAVLFLLFLFPLIALAWRIDFFRGRRTLRALGGRWRSAALLDVYVFKSFFSFLFLSLFFFATVFALAGFRWGEHLVEERRSGQELVICLDVSNSMLAEQQEATRLQHSIRTVRRTVEALEGVRIALVVFKGQAVQLFPLTEDRYVLETALRYVSPSVMTDPGSGLEEGILKSLASFPPSSQTYRSILLFSDGEYHSGDPLGAAEQARSARIPVYVVAVGGDEGAAVKLAGGRVLTDKNGDPVVSRPRIEDLEKIAEISGGQLFRLMGDDREMPQNILGAMKAQAEGNMVLGMRREKKDRFRFLIFLSLLFLSLSLAVKAIRWKNIL